MQISSEAKNLINHYFNLNLGGKEFPCPYFINTKRKKAELRTLVGKGLPSEIEDEVRIWSKVKKFDIYNASVSELRAFMRRQDIGIDCSGFVAHILNAELKSRGMKSLKHYLTFESDKYDLRNRLVRFFREVEFVSADVLTNQDNCDIITDIHTVKPLDMIRSHGVEVGMHVLLVSEVSTTQNQTIIKYVHSTYQYGEHDGMREGKIVIGKNIQNLEDAAWEDFDESGQVPVKVGYMRDVADSGIRRLKIFSR